MFEMILNASLSAIITSLSILIGYYVLTKKAEKMVEKHKILLKNDLEAWLNSEKGQKAIYSIGAIIGNGAKTGFGLKTKGGKFKWQDLAGQIIGNYVQSKVLPSMNGVVSVDGAKKAVGENFKIE